MDVRLLAVKTLLQVVDNHRSLDSAIEEALPRLARKQDSGLLKELCFGVMRWYPRLQAAETLLLDKPLPVKHRDISLLIWLGLYQLDHMRVAVHAAVSTTVACSGALRKPWAKGVVNAVLRRYLREGEEVRRRLDDQAVAGSAHPEWLLDALKHAWPRHWQQIVEANNKRPPMTLRVNQSRLSTEDYLSQLEAQAMAASVVDGVPTAVTLTAPCAVSDLPGFAEGLVSVQDAAAQLAPPLLQLAAGQRVLDACAAPGGKTCHMLESCAGIEVLALDQQSQRMQRVEENLQRLGLACQLGVADATQPAQWWDGRPFDRILLDAPCSGSGVIRRHPDIKWLRQPEQIDTLARGQLDLLSALWPLLKPGGVLLYATCSLLPEENEHIIGRFLSLANDAKESVITADWGCQSRHGRTILTGQRGMDGFYYARLYKD